MCIRDSSYAQRLGVREGFIPVLIKPDETLLECLVMNADPENLSLIHICSLT